MVKFVNNNNSFFLIVEYIEYNIKEWRCMKKIINKLILILGILSALGAALVPIVIAKIKGEVAFQYFIGFGIIIGITFLFLIIYLVLNERTIVKLLTLPITLVLIMMSLMLKEMRLDLILKRIVGLEVSNDLLIVNSDGIFHLIRFMSFGLLIAFIPIIIAAIVFTRQVNKRHTIDFSMYDDTQGKILRIEDTWTKINRLKVYKIQIEIPYYAGEVYITEKRFSIPIHMLHLLKVGEVVALKVNPKKREDIYIITNQGIL